ncbi:MAG: tetraacyldisaccharide 4-kinase [Bacteroidota bacterium]|jgi:tetraacyldisaccharide 4'-kinase
MLKWLLFPFSILYGSILALRNWCFDYQLFPSEIISGKSISVGNLSVGGTGKSPHVAYLIERYKTQHPVHVLSRGYGRKSKGLREVSPNDLASEVGDEALMLKQRFGEQITMVVSENRREGVRYLRQKDPTALLLLDDAFQHRWVKPGLSLLLTRYDSPFFSDFPFPMGRLREWRSGVKRADILVVSNSPKQEKINQSHWEKALSPYKKPFFFSSVHRAQLLQKGKAIHEPKCVIIVSGIASPDRILPFFDPSIELHLKQFPDHHAFTQQELQDIHRFFDTFAPKQPAIVTTEKDWVKIAPLLSAHDLQNYPWQVLPISIHWTDEAAINTLLDRYVNTI